MLEAATPAGICEAAKQGDTQLVISILDEKPELIFVDNPHNWGRVDHAGELRDVSLTKPVEIAAFFGHSDLVAALLRRAGDATQYEAPIGGYFDALAIALVKEDQEVVDAIVADVARRVNINPELRNYADKQGNTLMHFAARSGHLPLIKILLQRGAAPDRTNQQGARPIHLVIDQNPEAATLLLAHGAEFDLWTAVTLDESNRARELLEADRMLANKHFLPHEPESGNGFPLVRAAERGNIELVQLLLDSGARVDADHHPPIDNPHGMGLPIYSAVVNRHFDVAHRLLDHGASIDSAGYCMLPLVDVLYGMTQKSQHPSTPPTDQEASRLFQRVLTLGGNPSLFAHVSEKNYVVLAALLHYCPSSPIDDWTTDVSVFDGIASAASWLGEEEAMRLCDQIRPELLSPTLAFKYLEQAIRSHNRNGNFNNYKAIISLMLERGADPNAGLNVEGLDLKNLPWPQEKQIGTPLHWLSTDFLEYQSYGTCPDLPNMDDLLELAELFLLHGTQIDARHPLTHHSPLSLAVKNGHQDYVAFLIENGAKRFQNDPPETNPLAIARRLGFTKIAELLVDSESTT